MTVYVITDVNLGRDNVVGVYTDKQMAIKNSYAEHLNMQEKTLNEEKFKKTSQTQKIIFAEDTMTLLADGGLLEIDGVERPINCPNAAEEFSKVLQQYKPKFPEVNVQIVYCEEYDYYFPAITNLHIDYDDERLEVLEGELLSFLQLNNVRFE